jgi:hypothetical protein
VSRRASGRATAVVLALGVFGGGLMAAGGCVTAAIAAEKGPQLPITVTIPGSPGPSASPGQTAGPGAGGGQVGSGAGQGDDFGNQHYDYGSGMVPDGGVGDGGEEGAHTPGAKPEVPDSPPKGTIKVTVTPNRVLHAGDKVTVTASGFTAGEKAELVLYHAKGRPLDRGAIEADGNGGVSSSFRLPELDAGRDTVALIGWDSSKVGTGTFLMAGGSALGAGAGRGLWYGIGGGAGLVVAGFGAWFGIRAMLAPQIAASKA